MYLAATLKIRRFFYKKFVKKFYFRHDDRALQLTRFPGIGGVGYFHPTFIFEFDS